MPDSVCEAAIGLSFPHVGRHAQSLRYTWTVSAEETLPAQSRQPAHAASPLSGDADTMAGLPQNPGTLPRKSMMGDLQRGDALGRYVVLSRLGAGGMGVVYAAYDPELDRKLAIKLLHSRLGDPLDSAGTARLVAEARAMAKLAHPNVITVFDAVTHAEQVAVVMEFVDGESLGQWLARGPHPVDDILDRFRRSARGLAAAHEAGIVHRDFKPDNVMLGKDGRVRVMDFGLAHAEGAPPPADTADLSISSSHGSQTKLTMTGAIMGTPAYMAPEQFEGVDADGRADQFSFCVSLWEALYGERPFSGSTLAELTYSVTRGERRPLPSGAPKVPARVQRALERGLSLRRDERWPSMEALLVELEPERGSQKGLLIGGGVLALSAAVALGLRSEPPPPPQPCSGVDDSVTRLWSPEAQKSIQKAFSASKLPYAMASYHQTRAELEDFATTWAEARRRGCEAAMVRKEMTQNLYDRQVACLDGRLRDFAAVSEVFEEADDATIEHAPQLTGSLPELRPCSESDFLLAEIPPPEDPALRETVNEAFFELARLRALEISGHYDEAMGSLEELRGRSQEIDYDPLTAELAIRVGSLLDYKGEYGEAEVSLEDGFFAAQRVGASITAAELAAKLTHVVGDHLQRYDEALRWGRHGEAVVVRAKLDDGVRARVINNSANIVLREGRNEEALQMFERTLALREAALGPEHRDTAISLSNLARTYTKMERHEDALAMHRRAIEIRKKTLGDRHPYLAESYEDLAWTLELANHHAEALDTQREALSRCESSLGPDHPQCAWSKVRLAELLGKGPSEATEIEALLTQALPVLEKTHGPEHERVTRTRALLAPKSPD